MGDPALGTKSTVVVDYETIWNQPKTAGQSVGKLVITTPGTAYASSFPITFTGGTPTRAATAYGFSTAGAITSVVITDPGAGYGSTPTAVLTAGGGSSGVVTPTMAALGGHQLGVLNWQVSPAQELLENATLRGDFNTADAVMGKISAQGSASLYPTLDVAAWIGQLLFGNVTEGAAGGNTYHQSKITATGPLSCISEVSYNVGGILYYVRSTGTRVNKITIPLDAAGLTPWNMDLMAATALISNTQYNAAADDWRGGGGVNAVPMDYLQIVAANILVGGSAVGYIQKGSIDIETGLNSGDYRVGGAAGRGSLTPGRHKVSGSLDLVLDSAAVMTLIQSGSAPTSLAVTWTQGTNLIFTLTIPRIYIQKTGPVLKDDGPIVVTCQFKAAYDNTSVSELVWRVENTRAAAYYI